MSSVKLVDIRILPEALDSRSEQKRQIAKQLAIEESEISDFRLEKRSLDARGKDAYYLLRFRVSLGGRLPAEPASILKLQDVTKNEPVIIVGFGPAGMFAALRLIELGYRPMVLERGKAVRDRRLDIAAINKRGEVNSESNYCFGEGGAGTFSDGKLYTRSTKRGSVERILRLLIEHGADPDILIDSHPHIGTNKLPALVQAIRKTITDYGGEVRFGTKVTSLRKNGSTLHGVNTNNGELEGRAAIFATGHSARDVFDLYRDAGLTLEAKSFALGVRVEHPQSIINNLQYRTSPRSDLLPAASYSLSANIDKRGVFSFCMCPGGIICPAATENDEIVVNGWSPSKRNSYFANSGIVVEVGHAHLKAYAQHGAFAGLEFQRSVEKAAFLLGGGSQVAPAQRLIDFLENRVSSTLPRTSYLPGIRSAALKELFPQDLFQMLQAGFHEFGKKRRGFLSEEAIVVGTESRTSSPIKVPRDKNTLMHPELDGLFPCGEGAGYAGGIMSAAMDGESSAHAVASFLKGI